MWIVEIFGKMTVEAVKNHEGKFQSVGGTPLDGDVTGYCELGYKWNIVKKRHERNYVLIRDGGVIFSTRASTITGAKKNIRANGVKVKKTDALLEADQNASFTTEAIKETWVWDSATLTGYDLSNQYSWNKRTKWLTEKEKSALSWVKIKKCANEDEVKSYIKGQQ